jgi:hypothetical protein
MPATVVIVADSAGLCIVLRFDIPSRGHWYTLHQPITNCTARIRWHIGGGGKEQPVLLRQQGDAMEATVLLELPGAQPGAWRHSDVSTSPDRQTAAVLFSSKDVHMIYLVDMKNLEVIAQFESDAAFWTNIDWGVDGRRLAVADSSGVFVYDLVTGDTRYLVRREDLEFPPVVEFGGLLGSGADFVNPRWSPDGGVLLFVARCGLWAPGPTERSGWEPLDVSNVSPTEITFAVTSDGSFIRPLSRKAIPFNLSRDRSSSWINSWDQDMPVTRRSFKFSM